ncbi:MAG: acyltransferase 3 [Bacilli bacterium]|nr:acyltransferase 3 [Bacilli bacterium]
MKKTHLFEIDLMRAFIMLSVLSVHSISLYMGPMHDLTQSYLCLGALLTAMHFTRESFMFITGLVLFATYYRQHFNPLQFWFKRLLLIAIPYVVWNIVYILFNGMSSSTTNWSLAILWQQLVQSLLTGNQFFLYYVLVSIQLYVIFPILLYGLRKSEQWHLQIFIGSFLLQLGLMYFNKFPFFDVSHLPWIVAKIYQYRDRFVLTYQFWFIAGGVIFCHYEKIKAFIGRHAKAVRWLLAASIVIVWAHYLLDRLVLHEPEALGELVLQPIMIPYSFVVTLAIWHAGVNWAQKRLQPSWERFNRFINVASNTSFGIFLLQPFPLSLVNRFVTVAHIPRWMYLGSLPIAILIVYFSSMLFAYWIGKVPLVAYCVGSKVKFTRNTEQRLSAVLPNKAS